MWRVDLGFRVGEEKRVLGVKGVLERDEEKRVLERGGEARMGMA